MNTDHHAEGPAICVAEGLSRAFQALKGKEVFKMDSQQLRGLLDSIPTFGTSKEVTPDQVNLWATRKTTKAQELVIQATRTGRNEWDVIAPAGLIVAKPAR